MASFKPENVPYAPIPPATLEHFNRIPWCAQKLSDPSLQPIRTPSREPKPATTSEDSLIAQTLRTPATIAHWQSLYLAPASTSTSTSTGETYTLLALGAGLDGHAGVAHGGLLATVVDEAMAALAYLHLRPGWHAFTVSITVSFRRVVRTPGPLGVRAWVEREEKGRKMWLRAEVGDEGGVAVMGEGLFVVVGPGGAKI
jgi:thioesterase superfamily protein 4